MDIISKNKSRLLYQSGDKKTSGVVDLRCFAVKRKTRKIENSGKVIAEIVSNKKIKRDFAVDNRNYFEKQKERLYGFYRKKVDKKTEDNFPEDIKKKKNVYTPSLYNLLQPVLKLEKSFAYFVIAAILISSAVFSLSFVQKKIEQKGRVLGASTEAYDYLKTAGQSAANSDFENSINNFNSAITGFSGAEKMIGRLESGVVLILNSLPVNTPVSTAKNLNQAGENISIAGKNIAEILKKISEMDKDNFSMSSIYGFQTYIDSIAANLSEAGKNINSVSLEYIPESMRDKIGIVKKQLPPIADNFKNLSQDFPLIAEMLGSGRAQKYLILFENNSEIRAGGGFIGSYGIFDIEDGKIKNLFIDGIFNLDGQLKEKIIPPMPIQKISAAWSMHDANWFADFPTSAKKAALFYEKTGGPTVDGVIAITPNALKEILKITGPVPMPEYNTIITGENFLYQTQLQVEDLYDREKNNPKQFIADLAPKIIGKFFNVENLNNQEKIQRYLTFINIAEKGFKEKDIIIYHRNLEIQKMIVKREWGGKILNSSGDYLNIVHSNINGYKTDAVIDEQVEHQAEILFDGSIIDTLKITRKHTGGENDYDWYNRVNSDYMRVYVPLGSVLLEARGHTVQDYEPPIDYSGFTIDPDVEKIESTMKIDPQSGTHVFEESGKTVFGNWVYVSPGETAEVIYKYKLPYKIDFDDFTKPADKYVILVQKQLGSSGSNFLGYIKLPGNWQIMWRSQDLKAKGDNESVINAMLKTDIIYGLVFAQKLEE